MARALEPLVVEAAVPSLADHRRRRHRDSDVGSPRLQPGDYLRYVPDRTLRQVSHLGTRIGQDFLARAVIELLRDLQGFGSRPTEPGATKFLQQRQIVKPGRWARSKRDRGTVPAHRRQKTSRIRVGYAHKRDRCEKRSGPATRQTNRQSDQPRKQVRHALTQPTSPLDCVCPHKSESLSRRRARADAEEGVPARFRIHAIPETLHIIT